MYSCVYSVYVMYSVCVWVIVCVCVCGRTPQAFVFECVVVCVYMCMYMYVHSITLHATICIYGGGSLYVLYIQSAKLQ